MKRNNIFLGLLLAGTGVCQAQSYTPIALPSLFADHMVLQQNSSVSVWG